MRGYERKKLEDPWQRYLGGLKVAQVAQAEKKDVFGDFKVAHDHASVPLCSAGKDNKNKSVPLVPLSTPQEGEIETWEAE